MSWVPSNLPLYPHEELNCREIFEIAHKFYHEGGFLKVSHFIRLFFNKAAFFNARYSSIPVASPQIIPRKSFSTSLTPYGITHSILNPSHIKQLIQKNYRLQNPRVTLFHNGFRNQSYFVNANEKQYLLKVYDHGFKSRATLTGIYQFLKTCDKSGLKVSLPITLISEDILLLIDAPEGERYAVLYEYLPAAQQNAATIRSIDCQSFGKLAARLHLFADSFPYQESIEDLTMHQILDEPLQVITSHLGNRHRITREVSQIATEIKSAFRTLTIQTSTYGICHGDLHIGNVLQTQNQLALIDFDFLCRSHRVYDIATFLWGNYSTDFSKDEIEKRQLAFLSGYNKVRPLTELELAAVPYFRMARQIWFIGVQVSNIARLHGDLHLNAFIECEFDSLKRFQSTCNAPHNLMSCSPEVPSYQP